MTSLSEKEFEKYLALHGPHFAEWPDSVRARLNDLQESPTRLAKLSEAQHVEAALHSYHSVLPPSADLATRIVQAAHAIHRAPRTSFLTNLRATFELLLPHPAAAFASMLILGLVMGISAPSLGLFPADSHMMEDTGDNL